MLCWGVLAIGLVGCVPAMVDQHPGIIRHETPDQIRAKFHGPDVFIRAKETSTGVEPWVTVGDTAYVLVGVITGSGLLEILYPARPSDTARVAKDRRLIASGPRYWPGYRFGNLNFFVIASSTPLRVDKISEGDAWSKFDVMYDNVRWDPRHAITDLAAAIATDIGQISIGHAGFGYSDNRRRADDLREQMDWSRGRRWPPR